MFTLESLFVIAMQQRYGISGLEVTTHPKHVYRHLDERRQLVTVARPVLVFTFGNATVEKALPMLLRTEWITGSAGIAMLRIFAECEWSAEDIEAYIGQTVADLHDNHLVKGVPREAHRSRP
jgi:hypothetical protein